MRVAIIATLVVLGIAISTAVSGDPPATAKPADIEEQVKRLTEKLEKLEKRLAALEEENEELRAALAQPRVQFNYAPPIQIQNDPALHLLPSTELRDLFTVERPIIGEAHQLDNRLEMDHVYQPYRLDLIAPHKDREFKVDLDSIVLPDQK